jgi:hypothetical protein
MKAVRVIHFTVVNKEGVEGGVFTDELCEVILMCLSWEYGEICKNSRSSHYPARLSLRGGTKFDLIDIALIIQMYEETLDLTCI